MPPIFHFDLQALSRSQGRNSVAAAAYRAGVLLHDPRLGKGFDYRRRHGVVHAQIITPAYAGAIDRQTLWAAVEAAENRKNSVVAREIILALPCEISEAAQIKLIHRFGVFLRDRYEVPVDYVIHSPSRGGDQRNDHAHVLFPTRHLLPDGTFGEKTRELDVKSSSAIEVKKMRAVWETMVNESLASEGIAARVDCRSHTARAEERGGLVLPAQKHLGPSAVAAKRRGQRPRAERVNDEILHATSLLIETNRELRQELAVQLMQASKSRRPPVPRAAHRYGPKP